MVRLAKALPEPRLFFYRTPTGLQYVLCLCNTRTRILLNGRIQFHCDHSGWRCNYSGAPVDELPQANPEVRG